jgi:putative ABC transport system substrate-binding protein
VTTVGDPVAAGFAESLRHPGGNITGLTQNRTEIARKQIELLRVMRPRTASIAILWEPPFPGANILMRPIVEAAREASIAVHEITRESSDLATTLARMRALHVDAAFPIGGLDRRGLEAALAAHVAIAGGGGEDVETGALFAVEPDPSDAHLLAATVIDKILRGSKASDMPFQSATRYITTINARTAAALGIGLTPELRMRADRIVE